MTAHEEQDPARSDRRTVDRLLPVWLEEMEQNDPEAARRVRADWGSGSLTEDTAQDLATWVTARITDSAFNDDEGPEVDGPARITPADKESVHRWLAARGHHV
ncbi:hypothetical protein ACIQVT_13105 [Streptomyces sp. NPDC100445]|uniref:hypothetical protein n=1 Tax=Streptomyces sp. NPDC100445 TaxID=3366102 RepID=UPI003813B230